ncbi:hypothetical protein ACK9U2_005786 [Pseudomonas putida]
MSISTSFSILTVFVAISMGAGSLKILERQQSFEESFSDCAREAILYGDATCEHALAAEKRALEATARAILPKG